jgi:hypothetical protein
MSFYPTKGMTFKIEPGIFYKILDEHTALRVCTVATLEGIGFTPLNFVDYSENEKCSDSQFQHTFTEINHMLNGAML